jgi:hypothetical protein
MPLFSLLSLILGIQFFLLILFIRFGLIRIFVKRYFIRNISHTFFMNLYVPGFLRRPVKRFFFIVCDIHVLTQQTNINIYKKLE